MPRQSARENKNPMFSTHALGGRGSAPGGRGSGRAGNDSDVEPTARIIRFANCANVAMSLDADVVANNWPINTHSLDATADRAKIEALMRRHKRSWHVRYEATIDPLPAKLAAAKRLVLFRIRVFGGILEVLAPAFAIKRQQSAR